MVTPFSIPSPMFTYSSGFDGPFLPSFSTHPIGFWVRLPNVLNVSLRMTQSHTFWTWQAFLSMAEPLQDAWFIFGVGRHTLKWRRTYLETWNNCHNVFFIQWSVENYERSWFFLRSIFFKVEVTGELNSVVVCLTKILEVFVNSFSKLLFYLRSLFATYVDVWLSHSIVSSRRQV